MAVGPEAAGKALLHCAAHPGAPCVGLLLGPRAGEATDAAPLAHTLSAAATSPALETAIAQVGGLTPCSRSPRIAAVREGGERGGRGDCREGRVSGRGFDGGVCCDASRPGDANEGDATGSEGWGANGWRSGEPGGWDCCGAGTGTRRMILWGWADGSGERRARHFLRCVGRGAPGGNAENIYSYKKILTLFRQRAPHSDSD